MSDFLPPCELQPARLPCPWDFPGKNNGVGCHFLIQGIFSNHGSNVFPTMVDSLSPSHPGKVSPSQTFVVVQLFSHVWLFLTPWTAACQAPCLHSLLELAQTKAIESVMPYSHLIICFLLSFLPSIFPSIRIFSNEWAFHIRWPQGASASVLQMNIQGWFPLGLIGLISLQSKGLSRVFSNTTVQKHQFFSDQPSLWSNSHNVIHWLIDWLISFYWARASLFWTLGI